jgi:DNA-binding SARP family transcriptional activator
MSRDREVRHQEGRGIGRQGHRGSMDLLDFLKTVQVLSDLSEKQLDLLLSSSQLIVFADSQPIIKRGEIGTFLWIVSDGKVAVSRPKANGKWRVVATMGRGEIFGEMSIMSGDPTIADVTSLGISHLIKIPRDTFSRVIARNPKTLAKISGIITKRLLQSEGDDLPHAIKHAQPVGKLVPNVGMPFATACDHAVNAQLLFESGKRREALAHLSKAQRIGREMKSHNILNACLLMRSRFAFDTGREHDGLKYLQKGMRLGRAKALVNIDWLRPSTLARLCVKALEAGIEVDYVQELVRRRKLTPDAPPVHLEVWPWRLKVFTLGRFSLLREGEPVRFSRKAQEKPLSMLKMLIALGGKGVRERQLSDFLWPDADGDVAHGSFATTLHRLRTLVGSREAVELQAGRLALNPNYCWIDAWALERILGEAEQEWRKAQGNDDVAGPVRLSLRAIDLYKGPFLVGEIDQPWAAPLRDRLRRRFLGVVERLGECWERAGHPERAVECYWRCLEAEELAEELYRRLMLCLNRVDRTGEAVRVYSRCIRALSEAGCEVSPETRVLGDALPRANRRRG